MNGTDVNAIAQGFADDLRKHPENWRPPTDFVVVPADRTCPVKPLINRVAWCAESNQGAEVVLKAFWPFTDGKVSEWERAPGRTVADVIALCEKVASA